MGLPGSGKTKLAKSLAKSLRELRITVELLNADTLRLQADDWDFSREGRMRQAYRMADLAETSAAEICIIDMVAALSAQRTVIAPDMLVFMNTLGESAYQDTNEVFAPPSSSDVEFKNHVSNNVAKVVNLIKELQCA